MSITWQLEYTVHSCQVGLTQYMSNISNRRRYAVYARQSRASVYWKLAYHWTISFTHC